MNKKIFKYFSSPHIKLSKFVKIIFLALVLSCNSFSFLSYAANDSSNDAIFKAKELQLDGTRMQLQGNIDGAIKKYKESLALQPNNNLESLLEKLEKQNSKVDDGSSETQGAVTTVEPVGRVEEPAKPTAQPAAPVTPVVDRQGPPDQQAPPAHAETKDKVSDPIVAGERQSTDPLPVEQPPAPVQDQPAPVLPLQDKPATDEQVAERPDKTDPLPAVEPPATVQDLSAPVLPPQDKPATDQQVAERPDKTDPLPAVEPPAPVQDQPALVFPPQDRPVADQQVAGRPDGQKEESAPPSTATHEIAPQIAEKQHPDAKTEAVSEPAKPVNQQAVPPQSPQNQVSPTPTPLSQAPDTEPKAHVPADSAPSKAPEAHGTASGSTAPIAAPDPPAQQPVQMEMPQPVPQPSPVPTKRTNDRAEVPASPAGPDRVEQPVPAPSGGAGQAVPAEEVQVEQRAETAQKTEDLPVGGKEKRANAE